MPGRRVQQDIEGIELPVAWTVVVAMTEIKLTRWCTKSDSANTPLRCAHGYAPVRMMDSMESAYAFPLGWPPRCADELLCDS